MTYHTHHIDHVPTRCSGARGFLLVETLTYVALVVILGLVVIGTFLSLKSVFDQMRAHHQVLQTGVASLERVAFEIADAESVTTSSSTFGTSPGTLTLAHATSTRTFTVEDGQLLVKEDGVDAGPLTPDTVVVDELVFSHFTNERTEAVRIELSLYGADQATSTARRVSTTVVLRDSYE